MIFTEKSVVAQVWARQIKQGAVTFADVPALFNLRDAVAIILGITEGDEANV